MKIITKYKDYYDYLQGVYGIDPLAVFDRRKSDYVNLTRHITDFDRYCDDRDHFVWKEGLIVGNTLYILGVVNTKKIVKDKYGLDSYLLKYELIEKMDFNSKDNKMPLRKVDVRYEWWNKGWKVYEDKSWNDIYPNFSKTNLASIIPAEEMFSKIQDWILAHNEKPIIDTRTDVQKLESAGFDKKTSFRNM